MYLTGHLKILKDLIKQLPKDFFKSIHKGFNQSYLRVGIQYPDAPCGKYDFEKGHVLLYHGRVCEITKLFALFDEKRYGESKIFQFHKGFFSHLHAMTTDPLNTMEKIRNKIIMSILGYALLSVYSDTVFDQKPVLKPNSLWAGIILHIITDSYCPAHTIRSPKIKYNIVPVHKVIDNDKAMRLRVHESIKTFAKNDISFNMKEFIMNLKEMNQDANDYIISRQRRLWKIYKVFKFEYDINRLAQDVYKNYNSKEHSENENEGDIVAFQYYGVQPTMLHMRLDFLSYTKQNKHLYDRMMSECLRFLLLYKEVIETGNIHDFLENVLDLLLNSTFRIHNKYLKNKTNRVVASI